MTDQTIPDVTDEDRRIARDWAAHIIRTPDASLPMETAAARVLQALLPPPPPPTLADMTPSKRAACQWMQADTEKWGRAVITSPTAYGGSARLLDRRGYVAYEDHDSITPRPDLPRLEWPGDTPAPAAPALPPGWRLADHEKHGRVIVTTPTPDDDGDVYFTFPANDLTGYDWDACHPDELTYIDNDKDTRND